MSSSRQLWLLIGLLWVPQIYAQNVYTWVDANGIRHFSDSPQASKAELIQLPDYEAQAPAPSFDAAEPTEADSAADSAADNELNDEIAIEEEVTDPISPSEPQMVEPLKITLISPKHDDTIRSNSGTIIIRSELNRKLGIGEQLQLMMDGRPYGAPTNQLFWELKNIDRGSHTFTIQAIADGKIIASASIITVHLHRASVK